MDDTATDTDTASSSHEEAPDIGKELAKIIERLDTLTALLAIEVPALLRALSQLHREPLDLRAKQRLKRAEHAAKRIADALQAATATTKTQAVEVAHVETSQDG